MTQFNDILISGTAAAAMKQFEILLISEAAANDESNASQTSYID
jgi:hypothetical protein